MRIRTWLSYKVFGVPFWIISLCGLVGVLLDADHIRKGVEAGDREARWLHIPVFIGCSVILGISFTYLGRLLDKEVLGKK